VEEGEDLEPTRHGHLRNQMTSPMRDRYAVTELESAASPREFIGGSDDTMTVWVTARRSSRPHNHGWKADAYHFQGTLKAGKTGRGQVLERRRRWSSRWPIPRRGRADSSRRSRQKLDPKAYAEFAKKKPGDRPAAGAVRRHEGRRLHQVPLGERRGGDVGPDLTGVASSTAGPLRRVVLYPSAKILDGYKQTLVLTKSASSCRALLGDTGDEITLYGRRQAPRAEEVGDRAEEGSGALADAGGPEHRLSLQDFADIVNFSSR